MPLARPFLTVGLLGGSFDPPHQGHAHITREALKRFQAGSGLVAGKPWQSFERNRPCATGAAIGGGKGP